MKHTANQPGQEASLMILPESLFFSASHYTDEVVYYVLQRALFEGEVVWLMTALYAPVYMSQGFNLLEGEPVVDIESIKRAEYSIKLQKVF